MKRKITFLSAAFMLLAFLAIPLGMRGQTTVTQTSFSAISGNVDNDTQVSYAAYKGGGTSNPAVNSNAIRLYQNASGATGGYVVIGVGDGYEITSATIQSTMATTTGYLLTDSNPAENTPAKSTFDVSNYSLSANTDYTVDGISTQYITFACFGTSTSTRLYLSKISITYQTTGGTPAVTHTLTFSANPTDGGTVTVGNTTLAEGATTSISATANTGYVFDSWTVSGEGSSVNEAGDTFTMGTVDATLTANFNEVTTYTVTYHANVTGIDDIEVVYNEGEDVTVAANTFSNSGFDFSEWNTQADGDGDPYVAGDVIENINADIDLYAQWTEATPSTGGNVTFDATVDKDEDGDLTIVKDGVTFSCSSGALGNGTEYRIYKNATATFSVTSGTITNIEFTCTSSNPASGFATMAGFTTNGNNGTWTGSAESVTFTASNKQVRATQIVVTVNNGGTPAPSITIENNDEIAYDATSGSFTFTLNNPVDGGQLSVLELEEVEWIGEAAIEGNATEGYSVVFNTTQNAAGTPREGVITLTYSYGDNQTVTTNVTVTQAGNPDVTPTIAEVRAQGTGDVVTKGIVTSCVGTTGYIQDATAAICVYGTSLTVGDEIRVSGSLSTYHGLLEITNPEYTVISQGNTINPELMTIAEALASTNQGWYIRIEEATVSEINNKNVTIAQGDNTIVVYFNSTDDITFEADDVISLNGNIGCYNTTQIANPQNVEVQQSTEPSITVATATVNAPAEGAEGTLTVTYDNISEIVAEVYFCDANGEAATYDWIIAEINNDNNVEYVIDANEGEARTAYFKVYALYGDAEEMYSNLVTINQAEYVAPASITVEPALVEVPAASGDGTITVTYNNITNVVAEVYFCDAEGESAEYDWIQAEIDANNNVYYVIDANEGDARTAYLKVYALDNYAQDVYSGIVTFNQEAASVVPPTSITGTITFGNAAGSTNINSASITGNDNLGNTWTITTVGTTSFTPNAGYAQVGSSNKPATSITFTTTLPEAVNITAFEAKFGGFSNTAGTINLIVDETTVGNGSLNATSDVIVTSESSAIGTTLTVTVTNIQKGVKCYYISYTYESAEPQPAVPSITVDADVVELDAEEHEGTWDLTVENLTISDMDDFGIQYYDAEGEETTEPDWIEVLVAGQDPAVGEGYVVSYYMIENEGEARTAYFKVFVGETYSNLVTVSQEAAVSTVLYTYSINGVEGEINEAEEGATISLDNGEDLNDDFIFAGWTTDANDVSQLLSGEYTLTEEVTTFYAVYAHTTTTAAVTRDEASYVKVTNDADLTDGNYLIVYEDEDGAVAFNGGLETLDAVENTIEVTINNGVIAVNNDVNGAAFTIAAIDGGYSIMSMSGKYIGQTSNNNGMVAGENVIANTISITDGEDADIVSSSAHLRYNSANNQLRFRYYKSSSYTNQQAIQLYKYTGGAPAPVYVTNYYTRVFLDETAVGDINIVGPSIIPSGSMLDMSGYTLTNNVGNEQNLVIEDGAQMKISNDDVYVTVKKNIAGYGAGNENAKAGYRLITQPLDYTLLRSGDPGDPLIENTGMLNGNYDFYSWDFTQDEEWRNYEAEGSDFNMNNNLYGYLYANESDIELNFAGPIRNNTSSVDRWLTVNAEDNYAFNGWYLIGNSFMCNAYLVDAETNGTALPYYKMNEAGNCFTPVSNGAFIAPMEGIFYEVTEDQRVYMVTTDPATAEAGMGNLNISLSEVGNTRGAVASTDKAIIRFDGGQQLGKFQFNANSSKIYFTEGNKDYAIVRGNAKGEMPVNFKASKKGTYTLSIDTENVEMEYLHLIDYMTGADVDLLRTPSYTFDANTTDFASRFRLVFSANGVDDNTESCNASFAFYNGSEWVISNTGAATLQVVDVMGRVLSTESINGNATANVNQVAGIYMLRLVNGDNVRVQKIVVK